MDAPVIVYDTATQAFLGNRILDKDYAARFPGALSVVRLREMAAQHGWQMMTADVFLQSPPTSAPAVCLSEMVTPYSERLVERGVIPAVITSGESPNVAWDFYHNLSRYAHRYRHAFVFRGASTRIKPPTQFHPLYWPNAQRQAFPGPKWDQRDLLVMVVSNKQRIMVAHGRSLAGLRRFKRLLVWNYLCMVDPLLRMKDLYTTRLEAIDYFAGRPGFRLYGTGWEQPSEIGRRYYLAVQRVGAEPVEDKVQAMSGFRFALCFENCVFPGYVTEKIFDCLFAGCIPVYYGAPDITDYIPRDCFIDFRRFNSYDRLEEYLRNVPFPEGERYLEAASAYLASSAFDKFYQDTYVEKVLSCLTKACPDAA